MVNPRDTVGERRRREEEGRMMIIQGTELNLGDFF